jgi:dienelactone hydrolase
VIVMSEMPGIYPLVARFARWVRDAGFTVWMPHLFGDDGRPLSWTYGLSSMIRGCISREFRAFAANASSPVIDWLRALAAHAHPICGGKGVGAIGMCFTGNFALSLMLEPAVRAPVLCQPSLPIGQKGGMHIAPDELAQVKARMEREDLTVLAYRFAGDAFCRAERFAGVPGRRSATRFVPRGASTDRARHPNAPDEETRHSVVTAHLDRPHGEPTRKRDEILGFLRARLI